jgi:hypothetical protein
VRPLLEVTLKPAGGMKMIVMARKPAQAPPGWQSLLPAGPYRARPGPPVAMRSPRASKARQN